ncbi:hypothetical protein EVAR_82893_1 [Eumeta japonica]|uniref:Uncharacterized protein n=1 Tax=Eumeta variegata TaxID=151549 RepID=A0A4C1YIX7_EUMVA|nr:hypothetical protein EVAR_82893_1 [Eumeta japonica]
MIIGIALRLASKHTLATATRDGHPKSFIFPCNEPEAIMTLTTHSGGCGIDSFSGRTRALRSAASGQARTLIRQRLYVVRDEGRV